MSEKEIVVEIPEDLQKFEEGFRLAIEEELTRIWLDENYKDATNYTVRIKSTNNPTSEGN